MERPTIGPSTGSDGFRGTSSFAGEGIEFLVLSFRLVLQFYSEGEEMMVVHPFIAVKSGWLRVKWPLCGRCG